MVTGSFAEFRPTYFHLGTDFATYGRIGVPILAMQAGKVIKIQSYRYSIGNAILIEQDDGFTSRYGHLNNFSEKIWNSLTNESIKQKISFREDFEYTFSEQESIRFEKGEIIGYSGQTGIGPPHLHVELFQKENYFNVTQYFANEDLKGKLQASYLELFPYNPNTFINGKQESLRINLIEDSTGNFFPSKNSPIEISGIFYTKLAAHESTGRSNRLGLRKINLFLNEKEIQEIDLSKIFNPQNNRSCFIFDNYRSNMSGRPFFYFTHTREDSIIQNFKYPQKGSGTIDSKDLTDTIDNILTINIEGQGGKKAYIKIKLKKDTNVYETKDLTQETYNLYPNTKLQLKSENKLAEARFESGSVFSNVNFSLIHNPELKIREESIQQISDVYSIVPEYKEFQSGFEFSLKVDKDLNLFPEKTGLYSVDPKGKILRFLSSANYNWGNFEYKMKLKNTGNFVVLEDNSKPEVKILQHKNKSVFSGSFRIFLKATDTGSGVSEKGVQTWIDSKIAKLDYDPDLGVWEVFYPEDLFLKGEHKLEISAKDRAGNISEPLIFEYTVKE